MELKLKINMVQEERGEEIDKLKKRKKKKIMSIK